MILVQTKRAQEYLAEYECFIAVNFNTTQLANEAIRRFSTKLTAT